MFGGSAVDAAGEKYHVGAQMSYAFDLFVRKASVVGGDNVHDDSARAESRALGRFAGHRFNDARDHHLQSAAGR